MSKVQRVALIGFGAIGQSVARLIAQNEKKGLRLVSVLKRDLRHVPLAGELGPIFTDRWTDLASARPDVVVEAAGVEAARSYANRALSQGMDLVISTVGALVDDDFLEQLKRTASEHDRRILLPPGAVGGLDALGAASLVGLRSVIHTVRKPPRALLDPERAAEVQSGGEQVQLFEGSARASVAEFPDNTNATIAVSLAGVGVDQTMVRVIADPRVSRNTHEIVARGAFGELTVTVENEPSSSNPKTSQLAAWSIMRLLLQRVSPLAVG
jgi:aspartate dehydrogenase